MPLGGGWQSDSRSDLLQYGSTLTIEELTAASSNDGAQPRRLVLVGSALPFQGARWAGENAMTTTWYPGNGLEGTQQILGPKELPSSWEGMWRRTLLGRTPVPFRDETGVDTFLVRPDVLRDVFEDMLRGGSLLRVTWTVVGSTVDGDPAYSNLRSINSQVVREGRAKSWNFPHDRMQDIGWSAEFHWVSRGRTSKRVAASRDDTDIGALSSALESSMNEMLEAIDNRRRTFPGASDKAVPQLTLGQLEQLANLPTTVTRVYARKLQQLTSTFKQAGQVVKTLALQTFQVANLAIDTAHNAVSVTTDFIDQMSRIPMEAQATKTRAASLLRATKGFGTQQSAAESAARSWADTRLRMERAAARYAATGPGLQRTYQASRGDVSLQVLAVYVTKEGDTAARISMRFYGTPDRAEDLLRANRLPTYTPSLRRGKVLFIPAIQASARAG